MTTFRALLLVFVVAGLVATPAAQAQEKVFCVNAGSSCPTGGIDMGQNLGLALADAAANPGLDHVALGAKATAYVGPFAYTTPDASNFLDLEGVGATPPKLSAPAGARALTIQHGQMGRVDIELPDAASAVGVVLVDSFYGFGAVRGGRDGSDIVGIRASGNSQISGGQFETKGAASFESVGGALQASHVTTSGAAIGARADGGSLFLAHSHVTGRVKALEAFDPGVTAFVQSSVLSTTGTGANGVDVVDAKLILEHATVAHVAGQQSAGSAVRLQAVNTSPTASANGVALAGYARGFVRTMADTRQLPVSIFHSVWDNANDFFEGSGTITDVDNAHTDPRLVDLSGGDLRLRGSSPGIDRVGGENSGYTDVDGSPALDGNGDANVQPDSGAIEYRRRPPEIASFSVPTAGTAGTAVAASATATDPDGETVALDWSFGDGATASGGGVSHVYAAPGTYTVTLTATDEGGLKAQRTATITVAQGPTGSASSTAPTGSTASVDRIAPVIHSLRLSSTRVRVARSRRLSLRVDLSEAATLRITARRRVRSGQTSRLVAVRGAIVRRLSAGRSRLLLRAPLVRLHALRAGSLVLKATATDRAGNRSRSRTVRLRVLGR